jgi:hypothetical protein
MCFFLIATNLPDEDEGPFVLTNYGPFSEAEVEQWKLCFKLLLKKLNEKWELSEEGRISARILTVAQPLKGKILFCHLGPGDAVTEIENHYIGLHPEFAQPVLL